MNLQRYNPYNGLRYVNFNQDQECFVCATNSGIRVFRSDPLMEMQTPSYYSGGIRLVEMLFRSNYYAVACGCSRPANPNKLIIWDDSKRAIVSIEFNQAIKSVRLGLDGFVVVFADYIKVYDHWYRPNQLHYFDTCYNPHGICALAEYDNNSLLALPAPRTGDIQIFDLRGDTRAPIAVTAHNCNIRCMAFNLKGTRLATACENGNVIRVFDPATGKNTNELRRGLSKANIYSINFNQASTMLVVSSNRGTVHVFNLQANIFTRLALSIVPICLPSQRSFARFSIPKETPSICAFGQDPNSVVVISATGYYYKFLFNTKGEYSRTHFVPFLHLND